MVSVIVPNYNHARYLRQRIDSILNQTYSDFELILLDDCSKDNSVAILEGYQSHPRVSKIIINEQNSGSSVSQWKKGILEAKGEYIWIAESDDYADHDFIERTLPPLKKDNMVALSYSQSHQVDESGRVIKNMREEVKHISDRWTQPFVNDGIDELKNYFCLINTIPNASGVLFRKSVAMQFIDEMEDFKNYKLVGDKMFWTNMLLRGKVAFTPEPLNYFRKHTNNVRTKSSSKQNLIDNFKWYGYLRERVEIPRHNRKLIRNRLFGWWFIFVKKPFDYYKPANKTVRFWAKKIYFLPGVLFMLLFMKFKCYEFLQKIELR